MSTSLKTFLGLVLGARVLGQNNKLVDQAAFVAAPYAIRAASAAGAARGAAEYEARQP